MKLETGIFHWAEAALGMVLVRKKSLAETIASCVLNVLVQSWLTNPAVQKLLMPADTLRCCVPLTFYIGAVL